MFFLCLLNVFVLTCMQLSPHWSLLGTYIDSIQIPDHVKLLLLSLFWLRYTYVFMPLLDLYWIWHQLWGVYPVPLSTTAQPLLTVSRTWMVYRPVSHIQVWTYKTLTPESPGHLHINIWQSMSGEKCNYSQVRSTHSHSPPGWCQLLVTQFCKGGDSHYITLILQTKAEEEVLTDP